MHTANQDGCKKSASDATQTAHHHHHKSLDHHLQVHLQISRFSWQLQSARQTSKATTQNHHTQKKRCWVDTQGIEHVSVLRRSSNALSPLGLSEQEMQRTPHNRTQTERHNLPLRKEIFAQLNSTLQTRKTRCKNFTRPQSPKQNVVNDQTQTKGGHQGIQRRRMAQGPKQENFCEAA